MNKAKFDSTILIVIGCAVIVTVLAGFTSVYASRQASRYMTKLVDGTMESTVRKSTWTTLREGRILGRAVPRKGPTAYVVSVRHLGKEYRAIASVDDDGSVTKVYPLAGGIDSAYVRRLGILFDRTSRGGAGSDLSPLDSALEPLIIDILETMTSLERVRMEVSDDDR
ncbi:MAG: hypothetical protein A2Y38_15010 [Spirochaetes bacterium GWB1_59_5]|nr:MAG: hypothetical protein A2Y38_15010 [Spirochaetes bacterium GWB1_59_5]